MERSSTVVLLILLHSFFSQPQPAYDFVYLAECILKHGATHKIPVFNTQRTVNLVRNVKCLMKSANKILNLSFAFSCHLGKELLTFTPHTFERFHVSTHSEFHAYAYYPQPFRHALYRVFNAREKEASVKETRKSPAYLHLFQENIFHRFFPDVP